MEYAIIILEAIVLLVVLLMLWQLWQNFKQLPKDEDAAIGEERVKELTVRLNIMGICFAIKIVLCIVQFVLRYLV